MEHQLIFADSEYQNKRHQTRKEKFLSRMETLVPWKGLEAIIEPLYSKTGNGRRPYEPTSFLLTSKQLIKSPLLAQSDLIVKQLFRCCLVAPDTEETYPPYSNKTSDWV